jgi:hypothetical protein
MAPKGQREVKNMLLAIIQNTQQHENIIAAGIIIREQRRATYGMANIRNRRDHILFVSQVDLHWTKKRSMLYLLSYNLLEEINIRPLLVDGV